MSLDTSLSAFIAAVGADVKNNRISIGDLTALTTTQKANLVSALNELKGEVSTLQGQIASSTNINDIGAPTSTTETYSISKILDSINASIVAVKADILGAAPAALDTLQELAEALSSNPSFATDIATAIGNRVRFDEAHLHRRRGRDQGLDLGHRLGGRPQLHHLRPAARRHGHAA